MNVRLSDGTVRCADCFDASTYECETADPCTYCGAVPECAMVPVVMFDPETGQTVGAYQRGPDVTNIIWNLDRETKDPDSLWFKWSYIALVDEEA